MTLRTSRAFLFVLLLVFRSAPAVSAEPLPAPAWSPAIVGYQFALYATGKINRNAEKQARTLAADPHFGYLLIDKPTDQAKVRRVLKIQNVTSKLATQYAPPSMQQLSYFGRGLSREQAEAVQKSPQALVFSFAHPGRDAIDGLQLASEFALRLARQTGMLLWDEETREMFTAAQWESRRIATWNGTNPDVVKHIVIHAYNNGEGVRVVSLGMAKFGLPDLVIDKAVWSLNKPLGSAINALAQELVESARPDGAGAFTLRLKDIRHPAVRESLSTGLQPGARAEAGLSLIRATAESGDPQNSLVEMSFDQSGPGDATVRQTRFVASLFGVADDLVSKIQHNSKLLAASNQAKEQLPFLQQAFGKGLQPGEQIWLKAPFKTRSGGNEWMWIEVTEWRGAAIKGILKNQPQEVPGLQAGQMVEVRQPEVFDYLRVYPDGRREGDETGKLIETMQGR